MRTQTELLSETQDCPKCGEQCARDEVDVGVGIIAGPWGCPSCGWSEYAEYDLSEGRDPVDQAGGALDQYGSYHPPGSTMALAHRLAQKAQNARHTNPTKPDADRPDP